MYVKAARELSDYYVQIIEEELNVKAVGFVQDEAQLMSYSFKPQLKTLGPRYGKQLNEIRTKLAELDGSAAKKELDENGVWKLPLADVVIELTAEDLLIETCLLYTSRCV